MCEKPGPKQQLLDIMGYTSFLLEIT